jgi:alpha-methylacyl-CoA racemase
MAQSTGPLSGIRVIEMIGIGPVPHIGMWLSDMGADVIRIDRPANASAYGANPGDVPGRGRRSIAVDLKQPEGVETVLKLLETADIIFEGMRPGVMEKLGLGPDACLQRNPKIVYGRVTGWGQEGPLSQAAGHDINYIGITGALDSVGREETGPIPPMNLFGDFAGGALYTAMGIMAALVHALRTGEGQVVDGAITDGVIHLMSCIHGLKAVGMWDKPRGGNILDGGAPYYDVFQCSDGLYIGLGAIEPQFYTLMLEKLELEIVDDVFTEQFDKSKWPAIKARIAARVKTRTRQQWTDIMEGTDVCFAPVLSMDEAPQHAHNVARGSFVNIDGVVQSAPAPRFSKTPGAIQGPPIAAGNNTRDVLEDMGLTTEQIEQLIAQGIVKQVEEE